MHKIIKRIDDAKTGKEVREAVTGGFWFIDKYVKCLIFSQIIQGLVIIILAVICIKK